MWMITALVYMISSGNPMYDPMPFHSQVSFMTIEECQDYLTSEAFQRDRGTLQRLVFVQYMQHAVGNEPPLITITASCVEDHRV